MVDYVRLYFFNGRDVGVCARVCARDVGACQSVREKRGGHARLSARNGFPPYFH